MDRLCENLEFVALSARAIKQISGGGLPGKEQDFARGQHRANLDGGIDAIQICHDDVADEHIGLECLGGCNGLLAAVNSGSVESTLIENDGQRISNHTLIISHQYLGLSLVL